MARPTLTRIKTGKEFCQLSGEDASALGFLVQSGDGCISVTANVAPRLLGQIHDAWKARQIDKAIEINERLMPLHKALFVETSPARSSTAPNCWAKPRPNAPAAGRGGRGDQETGARGHGVRRPAELDIRLSFPGGGRCPKGGWGCRRRTPASILDIPIRQRFALSPSLSGGRVEIMKTMARTARPEDRMAAQNRKALHNYFIEERLEAGIQLTGTEVKSLRGGRSQIVESYAAVHQATCFWSTPTSRNTCRAIATTTSRAGSAASCCIAARSTS